MSIKENSIVEQYVQKFAEKFLKIFKKLGVKVVSENVVKEEFEKEKTLLQIMDAVSGNLNKVTNQITDHMK
jgi:hypothetical protein